MNKHTPNLHPLAGDACRLTYSNRAVQIRVGLELTDISERLTIFRFTLAEEPNPY